ncbi:hypothetical protein JK2ML_0656 [Mycobacterium leprae Kyoto-2]|uniref:Uncharacterized protein n=3 Tax=Mycobacterium leprae TaxID=1769 RepID=Q7AQH1_MYCLE|nr:hypothetical protein DIJ64_03570 [Mycobacterium leprae]OAR21688.1 hypothetical protein A8144_00280 [Mycobacterium leprae 3125609]OAX72226.1 hypothetical protein A3216_00340 [Mycobacterium leprae 7935681]CAR70750.1 hypothetical protein MLBr00656 [Mycobacterium leprae Br4923]BBC16696.1 hypothetical protein JK2ML_0656 [Mycobacterium leprae Kyoto-2]
MTTANGVTTANRIYQIGRGEKSRWRSKLLRLTEHHDRVHKTIQQALSPIDTWSLLPHNHGYCSSDSCHTLGVDSSQPHHQKTEISQQENNRGK